MSTEQPRSCDPKCEGCLLNQLASGDLDVDENKSCEICGQTCAQLEQFAGDIGQQLGGPEATGQTHADDLGRVGERLKQIFVDPSLIHRSDLNSSDDGSQQPLNDTPEKLGGYQIIEEIGRGGMGVVYRAKQASLGRIVALKVLPQDMFHNKDAIERFNREAAAAASLHHTNIVPVYEAGVDHGTYFYTMQLIAGVGLDVVRDEIRKSRSQAAISTLAAVKGKTDASHGVHGAAHGSSRFEMRDYESERSEPSLLVPGERTKASASDNSLPIPCESFMGNKVGMTRTEPTALAAGDDGQANQFENPTVSAVGLSGCRNHYRFVADVGRQAASALHHAHQRGIIHRDVKPSNLILDSQGVVWLADFGLAKQLNAELTASANAPGTLRYMSPERFQGQVGATADVYSLGASLYELLVLQPPFDASNPLSLLEQIKNSEPQPPKKLDSKIPVDLQTIIAKSMSKDPVRRYPTALEMKDDLVRFLDGQPIQARRISTGERLWYWARKRKALAGSLVALALLVLATAIGSTIAAYYFRNQELKQSELASANLELAREKQAESTLAKQQRDEAFQNAYYADIRQAQQDWKNGQVRRMLTVLRRYVPTQFRPDVRGWEWYYLLSLAHQESRTLLEHDGQVTQVQWSADGERLFSTGTDETVRIWDRGGKLLQTVPVAGVLQFALNPDATEFATIGGDAAVRIFETKSGRLKRVFKSDLSKLHCVDWSPLGDRLAVGVNEPGQAILMIAADSGRVLNRLPVSSQSLNSVRFSANGKTLAVCRQLELDFWDIDQQQARLVPSFWPQALSGDWHPERSEFAGATFQSGVPIITDTNSPVPVLVGHASIGRSTADTVAWSPDGSKIAVGTRKQTVYVWDIATKKTEQVFKGHMNSIRSVAWHPSGEFITSASNDGTIRFWDYLKTNTVPPTSGSEPQSGSIPNSTWIWQRTPDDYLIIKDGDSGKELLRRPYCKFFRFDANRNRLILAYPYEVWDTRTWKSSGSRISANQDNQLDVQSGCIVVAGVNGMIHGIPEDGSAFHDFRAHLSNCFVALNRSGTVLATGADGVVKLWDTRDWSELATLYGHAPERWISMIKWGHQGRLLASASADQTVRIWDCQSKQLVKTLRGFQSVPKSLRFSEDDSRIVTTTFGRQDVRVWDIRSGREVLRIDDEAQASSISKTGFQGSGTKNGYDLSESVLTFATLAKAEQVDANKQELNRFRHQSNHQMARKLLMNHATPGFSVRRGLVFAERALDLNPADPQSLFIKGLALFRLERFDEAVSTLTMAIDSSQMHGAEFDLLLAACLKKTGAHDQATKSLAAAANRVVQSGASVDAESLFRELQNLVLDSSGEKPARLTVTTLEDEIDGIEIGGVSLREAIHRIAEGGEINFDIKGMIKLRFGAIPVRSSITITGPGKDHLIVSGEHAFQIFIVDDGDDEKDSHVMISGATLANAKPMNTTASPPYNWGGAIHSHESLTVLDSLFLNNYGGYSGGAVLAVAGSNYVFRNCTFQSNSASRGGALQVGAFDIGMSVKVDSCTFESNHALKFDGAAIQTAGGDDRLVVTNSTFFNNLATRAGQDSVLGGSILANSQETRIDQCTFTNNSGSAVASNLYRQHWNQPGKPKLIITNTIMHGNVNNEGQPQDVATDNIVLANISHSILGSENNQCVDGGNNLIGVDPKLGPLADNGGSTRTFALLEGSPAIDAAKVSDEQENAIEFDQRGKPFERVVDGDGDGDAVADMGAFEFQK